MNLRLLYQAILILSLCLVPGLGLTKDQLNISAQEESVIDELAGTIIFKKNVLVEVLSGGLLKTDLLTIYYNELRKPEKAIVDGHVFFEKDDLSGTCGKGIIITKNNTAELFNLVHIRHKASWIKAHHIKYDYQLGNGIIKGDLKNPVSFYYESINQQSKEQNTFKGKSNQISINQIKQEIIFQGSVHIEESRSKSIIQTHHLLVNYDSNKDIEKIYANGAFMLKQDQRLSVSDRAILDYKKEVITLIGNARVESEEGTLQSPRIEMYMKSSKGVIKAEKNKPLKIEIELE